MDINGGSDICESKSIKGGINMAQWHDIHTDIMSVKPEVSRGDKIKGNMRFMRAYNPLWFAGCAGSVN